MKLEIPKDCDHERVKVSSFEAKLSPMPRELLNNRLQTYKTIAVEDVYAALIAMSADGSITKNDVYGLESYFSLMHPSNRNPDVPELINELVKKLRKKMGSEDRIAVDPFPAEFFKETVLDPRLIGIWRNTEYLGSGDSYGTSYDYYEFASDGTYKTGDQTNVSVTHRSSAGTWMGNTTGLSGVPLRPAGRWETEGDVLVLRETWARKEKRLTYHIDERGLLTQEPMAPNRFYVRVA